MSYPKLQKMHNAIEMIQAENALMNLSVISFPHMKRSGQKHVEKELRRLLRANLEGKEEEAPTSMKDMYYRMLRKIRG